MTDSHDTDWRTALNHPINPSPRALLKVGRQEFDVVDVSRNGLRIAVGNQCPLSGWIKGVLHHVDRNPILVDAIVVGKQDSEVALRLIVPIPV